MGNNGQHYIILWKDTMMAGPEYLNYYLETLRKIDTIHLNELFKIRYDIKTNSSDLKNKDNLNEEAKNDFRI
jgi:hypothetical protein